jgi:LmbE family N-acetylglucosaminyl deacetylase
LSELEGFTARDRVLVAAPHPDDEAIATGGVLQAVCAAGAACRVLVITDGDNNPWPQRWIEKRWRIGTAERARWGAQRRTEAIAALRALGVNADDARCLGLPDLGLTDLLMSGAPAIDNALSAQLDEFRPTHVFLPALEDRHPDHSALHVLLQLALLRRQAPAPRLLTFGVHGAAPADDGVVLNLSPAQRDTKRAAIMMHQTQMRLSERRFVAYARATEPFHVATLRGRPDPRHPVQAALDAAGNLDVRIDHSRCGARLRGLVVFLVAARADGDCLRRNIVLSGAARGEIIDTGARRRIGTVPIERGGSETRMTLPAGAGIDAAWIKLARPQPGLFVLDRFGWQSLAIPA